MTTTNTPLFRDVTEAEMMTVDGGGFFSKIWDKIKDKAKDWLEKAAGKVLEAAGKYLLGRLGLKF